MIILKYSLIWNHVTTYNFIFRSAQALPIWEEYITLIYIFNKVTTINSYTSIPYGKNERDMRLTLC